MEWDKERERENERAVKEKGLEDRWRVWKERRMEREK